MKEIENLSPTINPEKGGIVDITIKGNISFIVGGARPSVVNQTCNAYPVSGRVKGFRLEIPPYNGKSVWLVLDPERKEPVIVKNLSYDFCPAGSYLVRMSSNGEVIIFDIGHRHQKDDGKNNNWVVIGERFRNFYDISRPIEEQETPTTPGLKRDNDGFIPALEVCRLFLNNN